MKRHHLEPLLIPVLGAGLSCAYFLELGGMGSLQAKVYPLSIAGITLIICITVIFCECKIRPVSKPVAKVPDSGIQRFDPRLVLVLAAASMVITMQVAGVLFSSLVLIAIYRTFIHKTTFKALVLEVMFSVLAIFVGVNVLYIPLPMSGFEEAIFGFWRF